MANQSRAIWRRRSGREWQSQVESSLIFRPASRCANHPGSTNTVIILDTNNVSELLRPTPESRVAAWLAAQDRAQVYLTTISEAEDFEGCGIEIIDPWKG